MAAPSLRVRHVSFQSRGPSPVALRGLLIAPARRAPAPAFCVVVAHPWGFLGGCQAHALPCAERLAAAHAFDCFVFNFRGVGDSEGRATLRCSDEVLDLLGACDWVSANHSRRIFLVGSSAGAVIAGSALDQVDAVQGFVAVGYTFGWLSSMVLGSHYNSVLSSTKPKCFIMGTNDVFTSVSQLEDRVRSMQNATMHLIPDADHFSLELNHNATVCELVAAFVKQIIDGMQVESMFSIQHHR